ncbi:hypothetical protein WJX72_003202 [[Myrmecia] bisecta]|uniref:Uncharacterized protein n=1 Tax=[Myrmecia] bisecta TaxID=41462 RepID=A0AAW1R6F7_9CHLO
MDWHVACQSKTQPGDPGKLCRASEGVNLGERNQATSDSTGQNVTVPLAFPGQLTAYPNSVCSTAVGTSSHSPAAELAIDRLQLPVLAGNLVNCSLSPPVYTLGARIVDPFPSPSASRSMFLDVENGTLVLVNDTLNPEQPTESNVTFLSKPGSGASPAAVKLYTDNLACLLSFAQLEALYNGNSFSPAPSLNNTVAFLERALQSAVGGTPAEYNGIPLNARVVNVTANPQGPGTAALPVRYLVEPNALYQGTTVRAGADNSQPSPAACAASCANITLATPCCDTWACCGDPAGCKPPTGANVPYHDCDLKNVGGKCGLGGASLGGGEVWYDAPDTKYPPVVALQRGPGVNFTSGRMTPVLEQTNGNQINCWLDTEYY